MTIIIAISYYVFVCCAFIYAILFVRKTYEIEIDGYSDETDIIRWCEENCRSHWKIIYRPETWLNPKTIKGVNFKSKRDAALFSIFQNNFTLK